MIYNKHYDCFRYVHNKACEKVKIDGLDPNFMDLRNLLVTAKTKMHSNTYRYHKQEIDRLKEKLRATECKEDVLLLQEIIKEDEKILRDLMKNIQCRENPEVRDWEKKINKETRANAVNKLCESYKTAKANLAAGNIKSFDIGFMKKNSKRKCIELSSQQVSIKDKSITISFFEEDKKFKISSKMSKKLMSNKIEIKNNCDFVCIKGSYWLMIPVKNSFVEQSLETIQYCSVDPGIIKIATTFGNKDTIEYSHNRELLKKLNQKIKFLKEKRQRKYFRKKQFDKIEKRKIDYTNQLHWNLINSILKDNDVIFFGDIKSHDITKKNSIKNVNQEFNDLKFHLLKSRLVYKATILGKKIIMIDEYLTSQTCSECGSIKKIDDRIYSCCKCGSVFDRDINAAKNILMKGILSI